jgi:magnesium-transporting ATPase (P-type)
MKGFFILAGFLLVWLIVLIEILSSDFKSSSNKIVWLIMIIALAPIGVPLYIIIGRSQRTKKERNKNERINELPRDFKD